ncbi:MAG: dihydroorotase [Clostridia bacterium]
MRLLIKNGTLVDPRGKHSGVGDILLEEGRILRIGKDIGEQDCKVIDAANLHVFPGFVDMHCHLRDPGYEYKEDIESGTRSAAAGGFTSVCCMPNTNPVTDNDSVVRYIVEKAKARAIVKVHPIGAVTRNQEGNVLAEMGKMQQAGIVAVSDDGKPVRNASVMKKAMEYASMFGLRVISHCEDASLSADGVMNEGYASTRMGLKGIPSIAEDVMVARDVMISGYTGIPVHIAHVSTAGAVETIRIAKAAGIRVTSETCPHYFTLTQEMCMNFNTLAKVNPPLRQEKDMAAVIAGLKDGTIDAIATDHAPHHPDEKNLEFDDASNGMVGFETAFALAYTFLVEKGHMNLEQLAGKMSGNPADILGTGEGVLDEGQAADLCIADLNREYTVEPARFLSKSKNSPFEGFKLKGIIRFTLVDGVVVYEGEHHVR